jgi:hypothetical protein
MRREVYHTREIPLVEQPIQPFPVGEVKLFKRKRRELFKLRKPSLLERDIVVVV